MDYEGRLTVHRSYGLTDHLLALKVNQSCYIPIEDYNVATIRATLYRIKKLRGFEYITKLKKRNNLLKEIKVTRTK